MNPGATLGARLGWAVDRTTVGAIAVTTSIGLGIAWVAVVEPRAYRFALAALLAINLLLVSARWPRAAAIATLCGLPFLALVRRMLIPEVGWSSNDPLLLVGPLVALALVYRLFSVDQRDFASDRLSKLVAALLCMTFLQTFNPWGASLGINVVGLLFVGAPLLWFFIGRELASERTVMRFGAWLVVSGALIALYGLHQTEAGLFSWDSDWVRVNGYSALLVGDITRAFGTFSSAAEYAQYIAAAAITAVVFAIHRKGWAALFVPILAVAIFLASVRTTLILVVLALIVVMIFRSVRRPAWAATASVLVVMLGVAVMQVAAPALEGHARQSQSDLVTHQLGGVADPLHSDESTLSIHAEEVRRGMVQSFHYPLGRGNGLTTQAANTFNANTFTTEVDVSDAFVGLGLVGGVLYLLVVGTTLSRTARLYWRKRTAAPLMVLGVLVVSLGQWRNGGHYAVSPIVWFLIGWVAAQWAELEQEENPPSDGRTEKPLLGSET